MLIFVDPEIGHDAVELVRRFDANTYLYLIAAWSNFHLLKDCGAKKYSEIFSACRHQEYLIFSIDSDVCF